MSQQLVKLSEELRAQQHRHNAHAVVIDEEKVGVAFRSLSSMASRFSTVPLFPCRCQAAVQGKLAFAEEKCASLTDDIAAQQHVMQVC